MERAHSFIHCEKKAKRHTTVAQRNSYKAVRDILTDQPTSILLFRGPLTLQNRKALHQNSSSAMVALYGMTANS